MGRKYTETQKEASLAYQKKHKTLKLLVTPEQHELYNQCAAARGIPLSALVRELMDNYIASQETNKGGGL